MQKKKVYNFTVIIEKDEDNYYVGYVPSIKGCHTQGKTIDELMSNIKEAIELCLEVDYKRIKEFNKLVKGHEKILMAIGRL